MEKKMENEMETGIILGLCGDNGKENGNYYQRGELESTSNGPTWRSGGT